MGQGRLVIAIVVVVLSVALPGGICLSVLAFEPPSRWDLASITIAGTAWMLLLFLVNWWEFAGLWLRWAWLLALAGAVGYRVGAFSARPVAALPGPLTAAGLILAAVALWLLAGAIRARRAPPGAVALAMPFADGRFLVTDGGDGARSFLVNYHSGFGRHRRAGVGRSMRFAVDLVEIGPGGRGARGFLPRSNEAFHIWGRLLLAPCDGVVAHVEDGIEDNQAFGTDRPYGVGNHVVIRTEDDVYVVLGHMKRGSVSVACGDAVRTGDAIGRVGNSGWTERPHLHMQAMGSTDGDWWHGEAVPLRIQGRFPVRNQCFRVTPGRREVRARV